MVYYYKGVSAMRFETFKSILLSVGIYECEFYLRSTNKEGFMGYTA